jgi:hypothetical protein
MNTQMSYNRMLLLIDYKINYMKLVKNINIQMHKAKFAKNGLHKKGHIDIRHHDR